MLLRFTLNGKPSTAANVDPHQSVLSWLRAQGLTGAKEGCAEGECGACAVALVTADARGGARFHAVNSCLLPLAVLDGQTLLTVEGVANADGSLHPVQQALVEHGGSQCGYCTPGFVISLFCEYYRPERRGYDAEAISGNLCRCTGYRPIADAARSLPAPASDDRHVAALQATPPALCALDYRHEGVTFLRPDTLDSLFELWAKCPEATLIAGGTDLMVYRHQREQRVQTLISLEGIAELSRIEVAEREMAIGSAVKLSAIEASWAGDPAGPFPIFRALLPLFSSRLIRNRATLGGNLGTASPIGDALPVLLALDAELTLTSRAGSRRLPVSEFFLDYRTSALQPGELVHSVHLPLPAPKVQRFYKVSKRMLDDISAVAAAFTLELDERGCVGRLRMALGGVAATPIRCVSLEQAALGLPWSEATVAWLAGELEAVGTPLDDQRASAAYRRRMPGQLLRKFFEASWAGEGP